MFFDNCGLNDEAIAQILEGASHLECLKSFSLKNESIG